MGAGKGYTMKWLASQGLFPFEAFVNVDPDEIRMLLPEMKEYNRLDDNTAGFLTQKEVGYISEVRHRRLHCIQAHLLMLRPHTGPEL